MKIRKEFIILVAAAAALVLFLIIKPGDKINYKLPDITKLEKSEISSLEIVSSSRIIRMEKEDETWVIKPEGFIAETSQVDKILDFIINLRAVDLISEAGLYERYELDEETRITLKGYSNGSLIREFHTGKVSDNYSYTYFLLPNDQNIYSTRDNIRSTINKDKDGFRDKTVLASNRNDITELAFSGNDIDITYRKTEDETWKTDTGETVDAAQISDLLSRLSSLKCSSWLNETPQTERTPEGYNIAITGVIKQTLTIYGKTDEGYPAVSSDSDFPFILPVYTSERILEGFGITIE